MNTKNKMYSILFLALCCVSAQTYTMSRFILGTLVGGTLNEARNVGKNIVESPQQKALQAVSDAKETVNNLINSNAAPKSSNNEFLDWAKREYSYLEAGTPVVAANILSTIQELIAAAKEKLK